MPFNLSLTVSNKDIMASYFMGSKSKAVNQKSDGPCLRVVIVFLQFVVDSYLKFVHFFGTPESALNSRAV
jgi:hypothetical protein